MRILSFVAFLSLAVSFCSSGVASDTLTVHVIGLEQAGRADLPGVAITASSGSTERTATTNESGVAVFTNLPAGIYRVQGELSGMLPDAAEVCLHATGSAVELTLRSPAPHVGTAAPETETERTFQGTIVDVSGHPIPNAVVEIKPVASDRVYGAHSDDAGRFAVPALPFSRYRVTVQHARYLSHQSTFDHTPFAPGDVGPIRLLDRCHAER